MRPLGIKRRAGSWTPKMDSLPMLTRCFERQWAGLTPYEQAHILTSTTCDPGYMPIVYPEDLPRPRQMILWWVEYPDRSMAPRDCLISIKVD